MRKLQEHDKTIWISKTHEARDYRYSSSKTNKIIVNNCTWEL